MPIPEFTSDGILPPGDHSCTFEEIEEKFCHIPNYEKREKLFKELMSFVKVLKSMDVCEELLIDRSFATSRETHPGDIDIFIIVKPTVKSDVLGKKMGRIRGRRRWFGYGDLDVFFDYKGTPHYNNIMEHFRMVDFDENIERGILKVVL